MSNSKTETRQIKSQLVKGTFLLYLVYWQHLWQVYHQKIIGTDPGFLPQSHRSTGFEAEMSTEINSRVFSSFFYHCVYFAHNHTVLQGYDTEVERLDIFLYVCCNAPCVYIAVQWSQILTDKSRWFSVVTDIMPNMLSPAAKTQCSTVSGVSLAHCVASYK